MPRILLGLTFHKTNQFYFFLFKKFTTFTEKYFFKHQHTLAAAAQRWTCTSTEILIDIMNWDWFSYAVNDLGL